MTDNLVILIKDKLLPEDIDSVFNWYSFFVNRAAERHSVVKLFKKADNVDVLGGGKLHSRNRNDAVFLSRRKESGAVFAGVMVGKSHNVQAVQHAHSCNVVWS